MNEKCLLILWGLIEPSWKINFCSRFLQLSVFPWCMERPHIAMFWVDWLGRLKCCATGLDAKVHGRITYFINLFQYSNLLTICASIPHWHITSFFRNYSHYLQKSTLYILLAYFFVYYLHYTLMTINILIVILFKGVSKFVRGKIEIILYWFCIICGILVWGFVINWDLYDLCYILKTSKLMVWSLSDWSTLLKFTIVDIQRILYNS